MKGSVGAAPDEFCSWLLECHVMETEKKLKIQNKVWKMETSTQGARATPSISGISCCACVLTQTHKGGLLAYVSIQPVRQAYVEMK